MAGTVRDLIVYRTVDSPVGALLLAATEQGLVRLAFATEGHDTVLQQLLARLGRPVRAPARLDGAARELDEYFAGRRRSFDLPLDRRLTRTEFQRSVLSRLPGIAYGTTSSYAALAAAAGRPKAVRAVGTACAGNPLPVVVPCHRVVRSDGTVGQYLGGPSGKRVLLALEAGLSVVEV